MKLDKTLILLVTIIALCSLSCKEQKSAKEESTEIETTEEEKKEAPLKDIKYRIAENSFVGISPEMKIIDAGDKLIKTNIQTAEGSYEGYKIMHKGKEVGHFYTGGEQPDLVNSIYITSPDAETDKGIKLGSTWADLQKAYPDIVAVGNDVDSSVYATVGTHAYKLDMLSSLPVVVAATIRPETKIIEIIITAPVREL